MPDTGSLKTGEEYKESLRDDRNIWYKGEKIDVTSHPDTAGGVDLMAEIYDDQHDPEHQDKLTYVDEDGKRRPAQWLIPETPEDLQLWRESTEHMSKKTFGFFGRQLNHVATTVIGMAALEPRLREFDSEHIDNIRSYIDWASNNNATAAALIVEPQGAPSKDTEASESELSVRSPEQSDGDIANNFDHLPATLQIEEETEDGLIISGAKTVGTMAPYANELVIVTQAYDDPSKSIFGAVPVDADGIDIICRTSTAQPDEEMHPVSGRAIEMDAMVLFDEVFIPHDRVFAARAPEVFFHFGEMAALDNFVTLTRMTVKAELLTAATQLMVNDLNTTGVQAVRKQVTETMEYAQTLRAMISAAEQAAGKTEGGVLFPELNTLSAARLYGIENYPDILQTIADLAGQGEVMRFHDEDFDNGEIGQNMKWLLQGHSLSAKDKNRFMNLIWDLTQAPEARRVEAFDRLNGFPVFLIKEQFYDHYDASEEMEYLVDFLDLEQSETLMDNGEGLDQFPDA